LCGLGDLRDSIDNIDAAIVKILARLAAAD
jgi:chorismate mutase